MTRHLQFYVGLLCWMVVVGWGSPRVVQAAEPVIVAEPTEFELSGHRARQQLTVTAWPNESRVQDQSDRASWTTSDETIVTVVDGVAIPHRNGEAVLTAKVGESTSSVRVVVKDFTDPDPVSFKNDTLAALTKAGCNMGACHGSPSGKGGFRLSLRAFDPELDRVTLRQEVFGRRVNRMQPAASLLLRKPLMKVAHGGGQRIHEGDAVYTVLHDWIAEGLQTEDANEPNLLRIELLPSTRTFQAAGNRQQLRVKGYFSDGRTRDLTALTSFSSSNEAVANVSESGVVKKVGRGETTILARYLGRMATSSMTFLEDVPGFAWTDPPTNNFVDELVFAKLKRLKIMPSDVCSDAEFLRRAYLDLTGRLPQISETRAFLADPSPDKRKRLVDDLLETNDFAEFWTLKWADILRANPKKLQTTGVHKFHRWLFKNIRDDRPLDEFANELLTARGSVFENPPANFWRASRDALDATETTAQLFLGVRIQCAKCHNHPFERWSQDNYYGIAAAFTRVGRKSGPRVDEEIIYVQPTGEVKQPRTGETMKVHLLLKGDVDVPADQDRRKVFADWLTDHENPFFAKASVNRIWGHLMGRGIVEPVDDFRDSNPPSNAELLAELTEQFIEHGYSRKWAIRTIMNSQVYQLSARKNEFNADDEIYHSHANTRLLAAEQLLDAICQVTAMPESFSGQPAGTRAVALPVPPENHDFLKIFGQPQREMACQCERSTDSNLSQALQMINGPLVHGKLRSDSSRIKKMIDAKKSDEEIINTLYLAAVSREPVAAELEAAKAHIAASDNRRLALEDVGWAILNTKEFLFQH
ncbi:DUF1549 domain-containing protein [Thalassoroseus pseudoceratinae]|uniref:DUF1549 domain-containing protein n=1 Tax=Thalassoroseus pseudoceratinae TaxID=2713176 RepID=UPI00142422D5|nr:DUF1549 domain-containing protein [Thalassoroseus pseudoceratinae]